MNPNWTGAGLVVTIGVAIFFIAASALLLLYRFAPQSLAVESRWERAVSRRWQALRALITLSEWQWKCGFFIIVGILFSLNCLDLYHSSKVSGIGFGWLLFFLSDYFEPKKRQGIHKRRPTFFMWFCVGFSMIGMASEWLQLSFLQKAICHPGFVIPVWLFVMGQLFRLWREERKLWRAAGS
jgi:hypothetical protein